MNAAGSSSWLRFLRWIGATDLTDQEIHDFESLRAGSGRGRQDAGHQGADPSGGHLHSLPSPFEHETGLVKGEEFVRILDTISEAEWLETAYALGAIRMLGNEDSQKRKTKARTVMQLCLRPSDVAIEDDDGTFVILFEGANDAGAVKALKRIGREIQSALGREVRGFVIAADEVLGGRPGRELSGRLLQSLESSGSHLFQDVDMPPAPLPGPKTSYVKALASARARRESVDSEPIQRFLDVIIDALARLESKPDDLSPEDAQELAEWLLNRLGSALLPKSNGNRA